MSNGGGVTLAKLKEQCGCAFFESRYQAYVELMYYFGFFSVLSAIMVIVAFALIDSTMGLAGRALPPPEAWQWHCQIVNESLRIGGWMSLAEMAVSAMAALSVSSIMRSRNWAALGVTSIAAYLTMLIAKLVAVILTAAWMWANNTGHCRTQTPDLYEKASGYFIAYDVIFALQVVGGSVFLICCGLPDAWSEGRHHMRSTDINGDDEDV